MDPPEKITNETVRKSVATITQVSEIILSCIGIPIILLKIIIINSKSKKNLFKVGQCKQNNVSSHLKWVLITDKHAYDQIYWDARDKITVQEIKYA